MVCRLSLGDIQYFLVLRHVYNLLVGNVEAKYSKHKLNREV